MFAQLRVFKVIYLMVVLLLLSACGPSAEEVATMTAAAWTDTPTATATATSTNTPTATPTNTPTPIPTPLGGGLLAVLCKSRESGVREDLYLLSLSDNKMTNLANHLTSLWGLQWLPGGSQIALLTRQEAQQNQYDVRLHIMSSDGSDVETALTKPVMQKTVDAGAVFLSPDANQIAFASENDSKLVVEDVEGSNSIQLTNMPLTGIGDIVWSPDGTRIAFAAGIVGSREIYVVDTTGEHELIRLTKNNRQDSYPAWSPDGKYIAFGGMVLASNHPATGLYIINADGSANEARLASPLVKINNVGQISWSPDGTRIVMPAAMSGDDFGEGNLYVVRANGEGLSRLAHLPRSESTTYIYIWNPRWSPDGTQIVFTARTYDSATKTDTGRSYLVEANGTNLRSLGPEGFECIGSKWQTSR